MLNNITLNKAELSRILNILSPVNSDLVAFFIKENDSYFLAEEIGVITHSKLNITLDIESNFEFYLSKNFLKNLHNSMDDDTDYTLSFNSFEDNIASSLVAKISNSTIDIALKTQKVMINIPNIIGTPIHVDELKVRDISNKLKEFKDITGSLYGSIYFGENIFAISTLGCIVLQNDLTIQGLDCCISQNIIEYLLPISKVSSYINVYTENKDYIVVASKDFTYYFKSSNDDELKNQLKSRMNSLFLAIGETPDTFMVSSERIKNELKILSISANKDNNIYNINVSNSLKISLKDISGKVSYCEIPIVKLVGNTFETNFDISVPILQRAVMGKDETLQITIKTDDSNFLCILHNNFKLTLAGVVHE